MRPPLTTGSKATRRMHSTSAFRDTISSSRMAKVFPSFAPTSRKARNFCVPTCNALDPDTHHPAPKDSRFEADLGLLANRLPDRERRVEQFFLDPSAKLPHKQFLFRWQRLGRPTDHAEREVSRSRLHAPKTGARVRLADGAGSRLLCRPGALLRGTAFRINGRSPVSAPRATIANRRSIVL